ARWRPWAWRKFTKTYGRTIFSPDAPFADVARASGRRGRLHARDGDDVRCTALVRARDERLGVAHEHRAGGREPPPGSAPHPEWLGGRSARGAQVGARRGRDPGAADRTCPATALDGAAVLSPAARDRLRDGCLHGAVPRVAAVDRPRALRERRADGLEGVGP